MRDMYADCVSLEECVTLAIDAVRRQSGQTDDDLLKDYIAQAYVSICNYLWCDELPRRLIPAVGALASALTTGGHQALEGRVASKTQGARSESYSYGNAVELDEYGLTAAVRAMLPMPRLRCF